jgi:hypothetical protein
MTDPALAQREGGSFGAHMCALCMRMFFKEYLNLTQCAPVRHAKYVAPSLGILRLKRVGKRKAASSALREKMIGVQVTESEHEVAKALAAETGETVSAMFRGWLREHAKRNGLGDRVKA